MYVTPSEARPGDMLNVYVALDGGEEDAITGVAFGLEAWNGTEFEDTGWLMVTGMDGTPRLQRVGDAIEDLGLLVEHNWPLVLPDDLEPGWYQIRAGVIDREPARSTPVYAPLRIVPEDDGAAGTSSTTNGEGVLSGDPYDQCVTTGTAHPEPPNCDGDPVFEWAMAPIYGGHEGHGWVDRAVLLSARSQNYATLGFELGEGCGLTSTSVSESDVLVKVGLQFTDFDGADGCGPPVKHAIRVWLADPLADRVLEVGP
jgi:hypothetical protein